MTRNIDWDKPLSEEDRDWAIARGLDLQVAQNDDEHGRKSTDTGDIDQAIVNGIRGTEPSATSDRTETHGIGEAQLAVNRDRVAALQAAEGRGSGGDIDDRYSTMSKDELKDEVEKRNVEREDAGLDALPVGGNKGDLQDRLREDDQTARTSDDDDDE
jgi:hypothetical protein